METVLTLDNGRVLDLRGRHFEWLGLLGKAEDWIVVIGLEDEDWSG